MMNLLQSEVGKDFWEAIAFFQCPSKKPTQSLNVDVISSEILGAIGSFWITLKPVAV
jgi:hypothetical protein